MFGYKKCCCQKGHTRNPNRLNITNLNAFIGDRNVYGLIHSYETNLSRIPEIEHTYVCTACNARVEVRCNFFADKAFIAEVYIKMDEQIQLLHRQLYEAKIEDRIIKFKENNLGLELKIAQEESTTLKKGKKNV